MQSLDVKALADHPVFGDEETAGDREQARNAASAGRKKQNPNVSRPVTGYANARLT